MQEPNILPCPFCGGEAELWYDDTAGYMGGVSDDYVRCKNCRAIGTYKKSGKEAIAAWNKRVSNPHAD